MNPGSLWAITCYFNPVDYKSRLENYRVFRKHLAVPLVTVELSLEPTFQLGSGDADILVPLHGRSLMWQKERLLNIAVQHVPQNCDCIAWLDCDVVFEDDDWAGRARAALDQYPLLRLFNKRYDLSREESIDRPSASDEAQEAFEGAARLQEVRSPGLAWAGRRDLIARHGLYDACVVGSGDRAILYAALGQFDECARRLRMTGRRLQHYRSWAEPFFVAVQGRVGYLHGRLFHLWHGERMAREYKQRQRLLEDADFDPDRDIAIDASGCWCWSSEKGSLHESVRRYLLSRQEDGRLSAV